MGARNSRRGRREGRKACAPFTPVVVALAIVMLLAAPGRGSAEGFPLIWDAEARPAAAPKSVVETTAGVLVAAWTRHTTAGTELVCHRSADGGTSWSAAGAMASDPEPRTDLGDTALLVLESGEILASYRHNHYRGLPAEEQSFSIRVVASRDGGLTWEPHSTVDSVTGTTHGLWASFLLETRDGRIQCYYDDEVTPWREGLGRHQWVTMRTWNPETGVWENPVTVSRAHHPADLSRDGMPTVVELPSGRLLCVFESVDVERPFKGVLRQVTSDDGGRTWSWRQAERRIVWRPPDRTYNALAPWTIRLASGVLLCVFVTDEDRPVPDTPATGRLNEDVKAVYSWDDGETWSCCAQTIAAEPHCYLPGIVELSRGPRRGQVLLQYLSAAGLRIRYGRSPGEK